MAQKVLVIERAGFVWHVDLDFVADHRAKHYAKEDHETTHKDEYDYVMCDSYEGIDWFENNMNWSDIPDHRKRLIKKLEVTSPDDDAIEDFEQEVSIEEV